MTDGDVAATVSAGHRLAARVVLCQGAILPPETLAGERICKKATGTDTVAIDQPVGGVTVGLSQTGYSFTGQNGQSGSLTNFEIVTFNDQTPAVTTSPDAKIVLFMYEVVLVPI
ncbi:MAG: hypothetical protein JJ902_00220 [Roseibium sp.]|nr:hypothetical protein [Roseibium sp.]